MIATESFSRFPKDVCRLKFRVSIGSATGSVTESARGTGTTAMNVSPRSLQEECIDFMAVNWWVLWRANPCNEKVLEWNDPNLTLHNDLADRLLATLSRRRLLDDRLLSAFTNDRTCLRNVRIVHAGHITREGLKVLQGHRLISLDICPTLPMRSVEHGIGKETRNTLQHLRRTAAPEGSSERVWSVARTFFKLVQLRSLDLTGSQLNDQKLRIICRHLRFLEHLNISDNPGITVIWPVERFQRHLKSLSMHGLVDLRLHSTIGVLVGLTGLTHLDLSVKFQHSCQDQGDSQWHPGQVLVNTFLEMPLINPNLVHLDLTGRRISQQKLISTFLDAHPSLEFLGLWGSNACDFSGQSDYTSRVSIAGDATLDQYIAALRYHASVKDVHVQSYLENMKVDLTVKRFPPDQDDDVIQALLDAIPSSWEQDQQDVVWTVVVPLVLDCVYLLLEQGVVRDVRTRTVRRLLLVCRRTLSHHGCDRLHQEDYHGDKKESGTFAIKVLSFLNKQDKSAQTNQMWTD